MQNQQDFLEDIEVLTVETPEALTLQLPLAGIGPRFLALLIDSLIQIPIGIVVIIGVVAATMALMPSGELEESSFMLFAMLIILGLALTTIGYFTLFETIWRGQTPGKRVTGIRVVRANGLPVTLRDAFLRNLFRIVDNLPSNGVTGLISYFATTHQQRVGDLVAGTVVVREYASGMPASSPLTGAAAQPQSGSATMTPRLSYLITNYLFRANGFSMEDRIELTGSIIRQMGYDPQMMNVRERENYLSSVVYGTAGGTR